MSDRKSFLLRIDAKLYDELKRWSAAELRSTNGQIEFVLRQAMKKRGDPSSDDEPMEPS